LNTVIYPNQNFIIGAIFYLISNFKDESSIASSVFAYIYYIDKKIYDSVGTFKTEKQPLTLPFWFYKNIFNVITNISFIINLSRKSILGILGMWQVHTTPA
jgi:hypothetical protein